jgi:hypothetical protein
MLRYADPRPVGQVTDGLAIEQENSYQADGNERDQHGVLDDRGSRVAGA